MPAVDPGSVSVEELSELPLFNGESRDGLEWIAARMTARNYGPGETIVREGDPVHEFVVVLQGEVHFRRTGYDEILVAPAGQATGLLPFSRMKHWLGRGWAVQETRIASMDESHLRELVYRAPILAQTLVSEMTDRARASTRMEEGLNRLQSLGKLAAGLAHELNNPASAAVRSSARLREVLTERRKYAIALRSVVLPRQVADIMSELSDAISDFDAAAPMDALDRADLESGLADWLEAAGAPAGIASGLVDARITLEKIRPLPLLVSSETLTLGLRVLVADHEILCLSRELEETSRRVSDLVTAVKSYSYMDQNPVADVDLEQGIDATIRMFQHQLKHDVQVSRQFAQDLPRMRADGSALNQIWTNLIDNALDAMEGLPADQPKVLTIRTCREPDGVLVEVGDTGRGIPAAEQGRIFEPFFTTKPVGQGTGLGLDIVQRILRTHKGSIRVESSPGRTVFQVRLPLASS